MWTHLGRSVLAAQTEGEEDMMVGQRVLSDEPWFESRCVVRLHNVTCAFASVSASISKVKQQLCHTEPNVSNTPSPWYIEQIYYVWDVFTTHPTMRFSSLLLPLLFFVNSYAWDCSLLFQQELQNQGLTQLASLFTTINQTSVGQDLLSKISIGNFTFFAPTNEASKFAYHYFIIAHS